jgi:hypothetical protein
MEEASSILKPSEMPYFFWLTYDAKKGPKIMHDSSLKWFVRDVGMHFFSVLSRRAIVKITVTVQSRREIVKNKNNGT